MTIQETTKMVRYPLFLPLLLTGGLLSAADRPNILFIYTDDQSTRTVSSYPDAYPWTHTPNIDALAKEGIQFNQAYIGAWCMTSRASMLTGHQQHGIESMRMVGQYPGGEYDPEQCPFWPSVFRERGYTTAQIGKWHTGVDTGYGRDWDYQAVWNRPQYQENQFNYYYDQLIEFNGQPPVLVKGYSTDNYTDWAVDFINGENRDESKPWYLWLCYGAVHGPFTPADRHLDDYRDVTTPRIADIYPPRPGKPEYASIMERWVAGPDGDPVEKKKVPKPPQPGKQGPLVGKVDNTGRTLKSWIRQYHQGVLAIDEGVGRLLEALQESGQDENTLVVFTSDQGFAWGQHGFKSKVAAYHDTLAAPLIFRLPKKMADANRSRGIVIDTPVSGVDIPVTFFSFAGLELPWKMHGHDLTPLLKDPAAPWDHPAFLVHTADYFGSDTDTIPPKGHHKLIRVAPWYVMVFEGRYKYIRNLIEGETEELYDRVSDPKELRNLAWDRSYKDTLESYRLAAIDELRRTDAGFVDNMPAVADYGY